MGEILHNLLGGIEPEPGPPYVHTFKSPEPIGELEDGTPGLPGAVAVVHDGVLPARAAS
ncbi:MAG TPA: hypothetical protein VGS62_11465 [Streptosporangiaceae bacterium]|nr:hypothetical protein [Streptosporangiaceae bacterium]